MEWHRTPDRGRYRRTGWIDRRFIKLALKRLLESFHAGVCELVQGAIGGHAADLVSSSTILSESLWRRQKVSIRRSIQSRIVTRSPLSWGVGYPGFRESAQR